MPKHAANDPLDAALDRLWQKQAAIRSDFTDRTMDRVRNSPKLEASDELDAWIDAALSASPVEPSHGFTERTLHRIRKDGVEKVIRFPFWLVARTAAGMAATIALLFLLGQPVRSPLSPDATPFAQVVVEHPGMDGGETLTADSELAALLMLAEGLDKDARWLLHGKENTALLAFVQ